MKVGNKLFGIGLIEPMSRVVTSMVSNVDETIAKGGGKVKGQAM